MKNYSGLCWFNKEKQKFFVTLSELDYYDLILKALEKDYYICNSLDSVKTLEDLCKDFFYIDENLIKETFIKSIDFNSGFLCFTINDRFVIDIFDTKPTVIADLSFDGKVYTGLPLGKIFLIIKNISGE